MRYVTTVALVVMLLLLSSACVTSYRPSVRIEPNHPILAADLGPYAEKRAVLLPFKEPASDQGIGPYFAALLFDQLAAGAPFGLVAYRPQAGWYGLQSTLDEELATAADVAAEMGFDLALAGEVERFVYSSNEDSTLVVRLWVVDASTGELVHIQRLIVTGANGYVPPFWDPSNAKTLHKDDILASAARALVKRMHIAWHEGEDEYIYDQKQLEDTEEDEDS